MSRAYTLVVLLLVLVGCCWCESGGTAEEHQYEAAVYDGHEAAAETEIDFDGPGEEITMTMEEFKEKFGGREGEGDGMDERSDRHMIGMCWQSEMARCVNSCQEADIAELMPLSLPLPSFLAKYERVRNELVELCASYCQADVTISCTELNLQYGGQRVFKFGGKWPMERYGPFCEPVSVMATVFAALVQLALLARYCKVHSVLSVLLRERFVKSAAADQKKSDRRSDGEEAMEEGEKESTETEKKASGSFDEDIAVEEYPFAWAWALSHVIFFATFLTLSLYHTVDTMMTESVAYMAAATAVIFHLYLTFIRVLSIHDFATQVVVGTPFAGGVFFHVFRMTSIEFDYPFHESLLTLAIQASAVLWILFFLLAIERHDHFSATLKIVATLAVTGYAWIYLDFPPMLGWTADVHAICYALVSLALLFQASFAVEDYRVFYRSLLVADKKRN